MAVRDRLTIPCVVALWLVAAAPAAAQAPNQALLRLLQVLRDRGSITAQEYDEIRLVAAATGDPLPAPAPAPPPAAGPTPAPPPVVAADLPPIINKALAN